MEKQLLLPILFLFCSLHSLSSAFTPSTNHLILCGSNNSTTIDGRDFTGDSSSNSLVRFTGSKISIKDPNPSSDSSPLYHTARIFTTPSSYEFDIESKGTHLVRFHFFPFSNPNYNLSSTIFDVSTLGFFLLKDFCVPNKTQFLKEYIININTPKLRILFTPSSNSTLPIAFVNAIEVFSAPDGLISDSAPFIPQIKPKFKGLSAQGLETIHRINVGGSCITPFNDTLWRNWIPDYQYLQQSSSTKAVGFSGQIKHWSGGPSQEIAPDYVYNTAREMDRPHKMNITWKFPATVGFHYLVRMHFCDIVSQWAGQLYFNVYIHDSFAYEDLHPFHFTGQMMLASPFYLDFIVGPDSSGVISISVGPSNMSDPEKINAILNGLEIMKINNSAGSFDRHVTVNSNSQSSRPKKIAIGILIGSIAIGTMIILLVSSLLMVFKRWKLRKLKEAGPANMNCRLLIPFAEIKLATNNFDENSIIGGGSFGKVYKGVLQDGTKVAVKRHGMTMSQQGFSEFQTEIMFLSRLRHRHLVSLIGYCNEQSEMILVYEYMENGPLKKHLYGSDLPCLSWQRRLEICIGTARGLHYLHTGWPHVIIHRDVKLVNILLDEDYSAKVADFGLSKLGPSIDETHVSTDIKGTYGYLDPEYFQRCQLTVKSDIYSLGIVLLEVLCAQPIIDFSHSREKVNLEEWAMHKLKNGSLEEIVDPRIADQIDSNSLKKYWEIVERCLAEHGKDRPMIGDVLWNLENALQLQETSLQREVYEDSGSEATDIQLPTIHRADSTTVTIDEGETIETSCDRPLIGHEDGIKNRRSRSVQPRLERVMTRLRTELFESEWFESFSFS
ncbi:probable receptor-like protein kinase At5g24010 [Magnolia sinica]|uniref:probable receptor-like protein kinase At5g24010 n=1 Tax=Magnolia sinica TaxID=86752 RepID=UPI002658DCDA|nr:probable receptor-like protein kinase At5g24010 [Magnolia sinica]